MSAPGEGPENAAQCEPWYRRAFQAEYLEIYSHRNEEDAERAMTLVARELRLAPGVRTLDLCCGAGRHLAPLARIVGAGSAFGVDLSRTLLARARGLAAEGGGPFALAAGDMRRLPFAAGAFDRVVNLFTSFGYFEADEENERVLGEIARSLKPGGMLALDHINRGQIDRRLARRTERALGEGGRVIEERHFDSAASRVVKHVRWIAPEGEAREWRESVRVYEADELAAAMARHGLAAARRFGDYSGGEHGPDSPRMILVARKG